MGSPTARDRAKVNHALKTLGFGGLDDSGLLDQLAFFVRTHEQFRGLLMSTKPDQRRLAYESMAPRLRFAPKPLDVYECEIKEKAEREQWDIWNGTPYPSKFKPGEVETPEFRLERLAQEAIEQSAHEKAKGVLTMVCTKCTVAEQFPAEKRQDAVKRAYEGGWRWTDKNGVKKHWCPKHVPGRCTMKLTCANENCGKIQLLRVWDEQDGYALARRLGWEISDAAKCPSCSVKLVIH